MQSEYFMQSNYLSNQKMSAQSDESMHTQYIEQR